MLDFQSLLSLPRRAALVGLAAGLAAVATMGSASAQAPRAGKAWDATARSAPRPAVQEILGAPTQSARRGARSGERFRDRGEFQRGQRRGRIDHRSPRGYRGGHYETRYERVWVPGTTRREWVPARYGYRYLPCGTRVRYLIEAGHYHTVCIPGRYERRAVQVWVPARRTHRVSHVGRPYRR